MTETATRTVQYTHYLLADSSVIDEVLYNAQTEELYVSLNSGALCGYKGVPLAAYQALVEADSKLTGSVGAVWNAEIKDKFAGVPTSGVVFEAAPSFFEQVDDDPDDSIVSNYTVFVTVLNEYTVDAVDEESAIALAEFQALKDNPGQTVKVHAITRYL
jgi:hypothetical protein